MAQEITTGRAHLRRPNAASQGRELALADGLDRSTADSTGAAGRRRFGRHDPVAVQTRRIPLGHGGSGGLSGHGSVAPHALLCALDAARELLLRSLEHAFGLLRLLATAVGVAAQ